jgi:predicted nuclease with RNAse H fold
VIVIGIDLSSPSNLADTVLVIARATDAELHILEMHENLSDEAILTLIHNTQAQLAPGEAMIVGIDCPLSYQDGKGGRESDNQLRNRIQKRSSKAPMGIGMHPSSVMSPVYISSLTMRGMHLARSLDSAISLVEVHPGATIGLHMTARGTEASTGDLPYQVPDCVVTYKQDGRRPASEVLAARAHIVMWMEQVMGVRGIPLEAVERTHRVDACAAALAAWKFATGAAVWSYPAMPPQHPYPYSC